MSVIFFENLRNTDVPKVGGKNASLGEMYSNLASKGVRIPNGFAVTAQAYFAFLEHNKIGQAMRDALVGLDTSNLSNLQQRGAAVRGLILRGSFPSHMEEEIKAAYATLGASDVAVRSSATAEDLPDASFAGQQETFLNIRGADALLDAVRRCFASAFTDRAISYRVTKKFDHMAIGLSVGVQLMVRSDRGASGVCFSIDPETGHPDMVVINGSWGLGENVVQGAVSPDEWVVHKPTLKRGSAPLIRKLLGTKEMTMIYSKKPGQPVRNVSTSAAKRSSFCLSDEQVLELARWACIIEEHYKRPMDIEFAVDERGLFIVQARPETIHATRNFNVIRAFELKGEPGRVLCTGSSVGSRIATGVAQVIESVADIHDFVEGNVLVTSQTDPDWEPVLKKASAIVTNRGGRTCHAAIISRELGIPCIVGATTATLNVSDGQKVTVDTARGDRGVVYEGITPFEVSEQDVGAVPATQTKVCMLVGNPERALEHSLLPNDGVGLARMEFIISNYVRAHPQALLHPERLASAEDREAIEQLIRGHESGGQYFVDQLARGVGTIAAAFYPKRVILRFSDFKSDEYASLLGGAQFEPSESNPMLGFRGASRYYAQEEAFLLECAAVKKVIEDFGLDNLEVMIPFVRTVDELKQVQALIKKAGVSCRVLMMCEIPSNCLLADPFLEHCDGFSIGSNDLSQLCLGLDRNSAQVAHLFDERNAAVTTLMKMAISACAKADKYSGICGQGPSDHPDLCEFLIDAGIQSISVQPDRIIATKLLVAEIEAKK